MVDLDFTASQSEFRDRVRTWLEENKPSEPRPQRVEEMREFDLVWQRRQFDSGWAGISWPKEYGGRGLSLLEQLIWYEEYGRAGLPGMDSTFVGLNHAGPTLIACATDEQKTRFLPAILRGEALWCQGFSEPGAGSDLASLSTRAEIDGDHLVVTGQKIWTSFAHIADQQELLVRTDRVAKKHAGLSWVVCDMSSPGIDIRPIRTMDGETEFAEVFYDDVRIPLANVVGELNDGWRVAMSTLSFERGAAFTASQVRLSAIIADLIEEARTLTGPDGRRPAIEDDELARRLAEAKAEVAALRAMTYAGISRNASDGAPPGAEGSMLKLFYGELHQKVDRIAVDLIGPEALRLVPRWQPHGWTGDWLSSFSLTIGGGTSEIQRNIIGERVLGLPR